MRAELHLDELLKECRRCGKPINQFKARGAVPPNLSGFCRPHQTREFARAKREQIRERLDNIKLAAGCVDCGYNIHPAALDFDHRPGTVKLFAIGTNRGRGECGWSLILAEIAKCEVVCANCHRIRTVTRDADRRSRDEAGWFDRGTTS
jgi:hypothetical protein